jgi:outer membrane protein insertion porin family
MKFRCLPIVILIFCLFSLSKAQEIIHLKSIEFKGIDFSQNKLLSLCKLKKNQSVSKNTIQFATENLIKGLQEEGYLYAHIDSVREQRDHSENRINFIFFGDPGHNVYLGTVDILSDSLNADDYLNRLSLRSGEPYASAILEKDFDDLLQYAAEEGFPFAEIEVSEVKIKDSGDEHLTADVNIHIIEGQKVFINNIFIEGNTYTKDEVILRELGITKGMEYKKSRIDRIPQRLNRMQIFKNVKDPVLLYEKQDSVAIQIGVEEGNATTFDGVVGYIPDPNSSNGSNGYFTGLVDLTFGNLFGSARKFYVHWKKPDVNSEEFELYYTEPWVLNYPVDLSLGFERLVRDTSFVQWNSKINAKVRLFENLSFLGGLSRKTAYPDSTASRDLRLLSNEIINLEAGIEYDTRDYPVNPRSGIYYQSSYTYGFKNNLGPAYVIREDSVAKKEEVQSISLKFAFYYNLWSNQVFSMELTGKQIKGDRLQLTDYFWFGGSRSLRGYRENQFRGDIVSWVNLEYRFILNRNSRVFLFSDWGFYQDSGIKPKRNEILPGYGLGIRVNSPLGILGVDYGLGKGDGFGDGKIHFGIVNRF